MKLHDPTNKKGYNPGTLLVIEKLTGEKDCIMDLELSGPRADCKRMEGLLLGIMGRCSKKYFCNRVELRLLFVFQNTD